MDSARLDSSSPALLDSARRWGAEHPGWYFTAPLLIWVLFLSWAELAPPSQLPKIELAHIDKIEHAACYALLTVLLLRGWTRTARPTLTKGLLVVLLAAAWGFYLECLQGLTGDRTFDLWDALFNALGALAGMLFWLPLARRLAADAPAPASEERTPLMKSEEPAE